MTNKSILLRETSGLSIFLLGEGLSSQAFFLSYKTLILDTKESLYFLTEH